MRLKFLSAALTLTMMLNVGLVIAPVASADDILKDACTGSSASSDVCKSKSTSDNPLTGTDGLLYNIANIIAVIAGIAAVIIAIVSGLRYVTSGGDSQKTATAKNTLIGAIIGLIVIVLARALVTFVVVRL